MTTKELKAMQPVRTEIIALVLLLSMLAVLVGVFVLIALQPFAVELWLIVMLAILVVIAAGIIGGRLIFKREAAMQKMFMAEDVFVEQDGDKPLRKIEQLAVDRFGGNLKQALEFAATSPELSRKERRDLDNQLMSYENVYVRSKCGTFLRRTNVESRRDVLTRERVEADLRRKSRAYRKQLPSYQLIRAVCTAKRGVDDGELWFGDAGVYYCRTYFEYNWTDEGDRVGLVKLEGKKDILLAYAEKDWIMDESLFG